MFTQLALEFNRNPQLDDDQGFEDIPSVNCPFDASHIMQPKNLLTHINRCKSPNKCLYIQCKYDACHWIYPEQKAKHYQQCPTKKEYYNDLDLDDGDWDEQKAIQIMEEKALKEKKEKRKKKIIKIIAFLKMKKKLKQQKKLKEQQFHKSFDNLSQISYKQESYNLDIEGFSLCSEDKKEFNNFLNFKNNIKNNSETTKDNSSIKKKNLTHQNQNLPKFLRQKNSPNIQPHPFQRQCPPFGPIKNELQFSPHIIQHHQPSPIYCQQFSFMNTNPLPHPRTFMYQQQPPFINPQSPYQPYVLPFEQGYHIQPVWQYQANTHQFRVKKPEPDKMLKFEEVSNTQQFIKRSIHQQENQYYSKSSNNENTRFSSQICQKTQLPSNFSYENFIHQQKQRIKNEDKQKVKQKAHQVSTNSNRNKSQNQKKQKKLNAKKDQSQKDYIHKKDESSFEEIGNQIKEKKPKENKKNNVKSDKQKPSINQIKTNRMPEFTQFLDSSISEYNFNPNFHQSMNTTIRNQSMNFSEKSQFLEMKQMLEILQTKRTKHQLKKL